LSTRMRPRQTTPMAAAPRCGGRDERTAAAPQLAGACDRCARVPGSARGGAGAAPLRSRWCTSNGCRSSWAAGMCRGAAVLAMLLLLLRSARGGARRIALLRCVRGARQAGRQAGRLGAPRCATSSRERAGCSPFTPRTRGARCREGRRAGCRCEQLKALLAHAPHARTGSPSRVVALSRAPGRRRQAAAGGRADGAAGAGRQAAGRLSQPLHEAARRPGRCDGRPGRRVRAAAGPARQHPRRGRPAQPGAQPEGGRCRARRVRPVQKASLAAAAAAAPPRRVRGCHPCNSACGRAWRPPEPAPPTPTQAPEHGGEVAARPGTRVAAGAGGGLGWVPAVPAAAPAPRAGPLGSLPPQAQATPCLPGA
jgi:hypothetical protein